MPRSKGNAKKEKKSPAVQLWIRVSGFKDILKLERSAETLVGIIETDSYRKPESFHTEMLRNNSYLE